MRAALIVLVAVLVIAHVTIDDVSAQKDPCQVTADAAALAATIAANACALAVEIAANATASAAWIAVRLTTTDSCGCRKWGVGCKCFE